MDIRTGPCVPLTGRKRPLAGRFSQHWPEEPARLAALFQVLTGRPAAEAWSSGDALGPGRLLVVSDAYVAALLEVEMARRSATDDETRHDIFARIAADWRARLSESEDRGSVVHSELGVVDAGWQAGRAHAKQQRLYAWYGPGVSLWSDEKMQREVERWSESSGSRS